jgi:hypothetical protein
MIVGPEVFELVPGEFLHISLLLAHTPFFKKELMLKS